MKSDHALSVLVELVWVVQFAQLLVINSESELLELASGLDHSKWKAPRALRNLADVTPLSFPRI